MANPVEVWKQQKHGLDVWPDLVRHAAARTPMDQIEPTDLERMKFYGVFYRKRDTPGTYMLRLRITANELSADQARAVAFIAYEYGYGIVDVTTRANLQIQGLDIDQVPKALARLEEFGLTTRLSGHDNVRNVFHHPFSGVDPEELIDTRDLCRQLTALVLDSRVYSDLPRKFNVALNGRPAAGIHYWTQDIAYLAEGGPSGAVFFKVLIAGKQGQTPQLGRHLPILVRPEQVRAVTKALLDLFREQGPREKRDQCRFAVLVDRLGVGGVLEELERRLDFPLIPGITEPAPPAGYEDLVGWFPQKQAGRWTMGLSIPLGRMTWQQLEGAAIAAARWTSGRLRTSPEQGLAILDVPSEFRDAIAADVARYGLSVHADSLERNLVACTGKQFCNLAVSETKGHAYQLIEQLRRRALVLHGVRIHMSGCPSSCALHHTADIGLKGVRVKRLLGTKEGFDVFLAGGVSGRIQTGIPYRLGVDVDQLPQLIEDVVRAYYLHHKPGQTFSAYWREKLREAQAAKVGEDEYFPPLWECEKCSRQYRGEDPPIFCPGCSALRRHFARVELGESAAVLPASVSAPAGAAAAPDPAKPSPAATRPHPAEASQHARSAPASSNAKDHESEPQDRQTGDAGRSATFSQAKDRVVVPGDASAADASGNDFVPVCPADDLAEGQRRLVECAGKTIALVRQGGCIHAYDHCCPHEGGPLGDGDVSEGVVTCPLHGWQFDLATGAGIDPADESIGVYPVKTTDGQVCLLPKADASGG